MDQTKRSFEEVAAAIGRAGGTIPGLEIIDLGPLNTSSGIYPFYLLKLNPIHPVADPITVYLSGGIHGDEPAGVWAILEFLKRFKDMDGSYHHARFTILPCINPSGFERNTRNNIDDIDLNRQFRLDSPSPEVTLVKQAVDNRPFDLTMEFHEDVDSPGFYLYELTQNGEPSWGREIINRVAEKYPVNRDEKIDEMTAVEGVIHRSGDHDDFHQTIRSIKEWPQAFYHFSNGGPRCYTTETPVTLSRAERADIHLTALDVALQKIWATRDSRNR